MKIHVAQQGDTLWSIAKKYGIPFEQLEKANTQLSSPGTIYPGMKIKVPMPEEQEPKEPEVPQQMTEKQPSMGDVSGSTPPQTNPKLKPKPVPQPQPQPTPYPTTYSYQTPTPLPQPYYWYPEPPTPYEIIPYVGFYYAPSHFYHPPHYQAPIYPQLPPKPYPYPQPKQPDYYRAPENLNFGVPPIDEV